MSDENLTPEELPMEDKKKAINLQDLVYVKKYINESMNKKLEAEIPGMVADEMNEGYYTQAETDATFYKKTDVVANASHAVNADNATNAVNAVNATNANYAENANEAINATNAVNADKAAEATSADRADYASNAENADYATNAGHATNATHAESADEATNATNAINAVLKTDGSYAGLVIEEAVMKLNDGTTLYAESAVNADTAGKAEMATYADSANYAENAGYAESANEAANAVHATSADHANNATNAESANLATNATNAVLKTDGSYGGLVIDENGVLKFGDTIIPQKKPLWKGEEFVDPGAGLWIEFDNYSLTDGDKIEIVWDYYKSDTPVILNGVSTGVYGEFHYTNIIGAEDCIATLALSGVITTQYGPGARLFAPYIILDDNNPPDTTKIGFFGCIHTIGGEESETATVKIKVSGDTNTYTDDITIYKNDNTITLDDSHRLKIKAIYKIIE